MLRQIGETILPRVLPNRYSTTLLAIGYRYSQQKNFRRSLGPRNTTLVEERFGLTVQHGPFKGMRYPRAVAYSRFSVPQLVGSYERELHPAIERVLADPTYRRFVDIGSAEGYYSVGLAYATSGRSVYAYEVEPFELRYTRLMARENGVEDRVELAGWCSPEKLIARCPDRSFVLSDCEGYEGSLFTPEVVAALAHSDVLIELHPWGQSVDLTRVLLDRFRATHDGQLVTAERHRVTDYPELNGLDLSDDAIEEKRQPNQQWAIFTAKSI